MNKNRSIIWALIILLAFSSYFNYRQYEKVNYYKTLRMNSAKSMYRNAWYHMQTIIHFGYIALATNDEENLKNSFRIIGENQEGISSNFRTWDSYSDGIMGFEIRRINDRLTILIREVIKEIEKEGWSEKLREEFEGYLIDYTKLKDAYYKIMQLNFNRNYYNQIKAIEEEVTQELSHYLNNNYYLRGGQPEEGALRRDEYEHNEKAIMEMINKFEPEAIELAKQYMEIIVPDYNSKGYELLGLTGYSYSTTPPVYRVTVGFIKRNIKRGIDENITIDLTLDGQLAGINTNYIRRDGSSVSKIPVFEEIYNEEEIVNIIADKIKALNYAEEFEFASYSAGNDGKARIIYSKIINGILTNIEIYVHATLNGRIESLHGFKSYVENYDEFINAVYNVDFSKVITEDVAREAIGKQNVILNKGRLYYRYQYPSESKLLYRFDIRAGERRLRIYIDAITGDEVNIEPNYRD